MNEEFQVDLYDNGFFIQSLSQKLLVKGMRWEFHKWEQEENNLIIHFITNSKSFTLLLKSNQCYVQDQTQLLLGITVPSMVFEIVKKHVLELCQH